ncbi:hypothetical protein NHP21011_10930 [Helicobacter heilmannii]|nr:hypothetical protein NHP21011_10930 [Helicobacter heilmannii]
MALTAQHPQPAKKTRPAQTDKGKTQVQTVTLDQKEVKANQRKAEISKAIKTNKLLEENKEKANSKPAGIKEKEGKPQVLATKKTRPAQTDKGKTQVLLTKAVLQVLPATLVLQEVQEVQEVQVRLAALAQQAQLEVRAALATPAPLPAVVCLVQPAII